MNKKLFHFLVGAASAEKVKVGKRSKLKVDLSPGLLPTALIAYAVYKFLTVDD
ncbi:Putative uncharacterized protein [Lactobacillus equicursoris 66c]|uniref:Uncharacterized protein n=1 Tax=Lactobacillus equicursoris 66c TaxID=872326 RepID=K0NYB5_9LACO|nr:hypothetical protein [Lactobacillus equicursoris]MDD6408051.1 hypothetical protein [Lactobacillus equicursoris]CCK84650.1 Putative uncharacterized protein [Lactobacillus equicursoris 66c]